MIGPFRSLLLHALDYCPDTGEFRWAISKGAAKAGSKAGTVNTNGYAVIRFYGKDRLANRLAWIMTHGELPNGLMIDHINGNKSDNRISNLRLVNRAENGFNRHSTKAESGHVGVFRSKGRWRARIHRHGKRYEIGSFDTVEEAKDAYQNTKRDLHKIKQRML